MNSRSTPLPIIECKKHSTQYITNYCCTTFEPLCPDCINDHFNYHHQNNIKPEVDTLKRVRDMCALKTKKVAEYLDKELSRLGYGSHGKSNTFQKKTLADLDDTRHK